MKTPVAEKAPEVTATATPEKAEEKTAPKRKPGRPRKAKAEEKTPAPVVKEESKKQNRN